MTARPKFLRKSETGWWAQAPAKVNLYLDVLNRRDDGFHDVETLLAPVGLFDTLHLKPKARGDRTITLRVHDCLGKRFGGGDVPTDDRNLVVRALSRLQDATGAKSGLEVDLWKRIPSEAGLGGGSSDAAAALLAGRQLWDAKLPTEDLSTLAAGLGSDVPAMLNPGASVCRGRGEKVDPIDLPTGLPCLLVQPPTGLGAGQVYSEFSPEQAGNTQDGRLTELITALREGRLRDVSQLMLNRLQPPAERITNWIGRLRGGFERLPIAAHQMSGSGSVYFGLCDNWKLAKRMAAKLSQLWSDQTELTGEAGTGRAVWVGLAGLI